MAGKKLNVTVPEYQLEIYDEEADRLGFASRSEYVRSMINAGRREFGLDPQGSTGEDGAARASLEDRIVALLEEADGLTEEEVVAALTEDVEERVTDILNELNDEERIDYDVRRSGFVVVEE